MVTATHETTIGDQLTALISLQHIDSKIDQIKQLRGDLPEEIRDLEDEKEGLTLRLAPSRLLRMRVKQKASLRNMRNSNFRFATIVNTTL